MVSRGNLPDSFDCHKMLLSHKYVTFGDCHKMFSNHKYVTFGVYDKHIYMTTRCHKNPILEDFGN